MSQFEEPYFQVDGDTAYPSVHGAGPWDPNMLHGGAPASLIAWIVDNLPSEREMNISRLTIDLKRPVPIAPLKIETRMTREGRQIQAMDVSLFADGKECVRAAALKIRKTDYPPPENAELPEVAFPGPEGLDKPERFQREGPHFNEAIDMRMVPPSQSPVGQAAAWFRFERPFIGGVETTPLMCASAAADYSNGIGSPLDFAKWTFINADLSIHFLRAPVGEWFMLAGEVWIGPDGRGIGHGRLADKDGYFGRSTQSLVIAPR